VPLREHNSYSGILGVFHNAGYDQTVSLAQVFWMKDAQGQPARFFLGAERALSIAADFANFGSDIAQLRKNRPGLGAVLPAPGPFRGRWSSGGGCQSNRSAQMGEDCFDFVDADVEADGSFGRDAREQASRLS